MSGSVPIDQQTTQPTVTLGEVLEARCQALGLSVDDIHQATGIEAHRIEAVMRGRHDLSHRELHRVLRACRAEPGANRFSTVGVEVDLDEGWVALRRIRRRWGARPPADQNLICYLDLVSQDRYLAPGEHIPLKSIDLSLLRPALAIRPSAVLVKLDHRPGPLSAQVPARSCR